MGALLYRASRDGWQAASDFHTRCDDKGSTLVVIRDLKGHVFGGYTERNWKDGGFKVDNNAWLFWIKCHAGLPPTKTPVTKAEKAVMCGAVNGPCFGGGCDIFLNYDMHQGAIAWGHSYKLPEGASDTFLTGKAGGKLYQMSNEVEVYQVV